MLKICDSCEKEGYIVKEYSGELQCNYCLERYCAECTMLLNLDESVICEFCEEANKNEEEVDEIYI